MHGARREPDTETDIKAQIDGHLESPLKPCPKLEYILVSDDCQRTAWNRLVDHVLVTYSEQVGQYVTFKR